MFQGGEGTGFGCLAGLLALAGSFPFLVELAGLAQSGGWVLAAAGDRNKELLEELAYA